MLHNKVVHQSKLLLVKRLHTLLRSIQMPITTTTKNNPFKRPLNRKNQQPNNKRRLNP